MQTLCMDLQKLLGNPLLALYEVRCTSRFCCQSTIQLFFGPFPMHIQRIVRCASRA